MPATFCDKLRSGAVMSGMVGDWLYVRYWFDSVRGAYYLLVYSEPETMYGREPGRPTVELRDASGSVIGDGGSFLRQSLWDEVFAVVGAGGRPATLRELVLYVPITSIDGEPVVWEELEGLGEPWDAGVVAAAMAESPKAAAWVLVKREGELDMLLVVHGVFTGGGVSDGWRLTVIGLDEWLHCVFSKATSSALGELLAVIDGVTGKDKTWRLVEG